MDERPTGQVAVPGLGCVVQMRFCFVSLPFSTVNMRRYEMHGRDWDITIILLDQLKILMSIFGSVFHCPESCVYCRVEPALHESPMRDSTTGGPCESQPYRGAL